MVHKVIKIGYRIFKKWKSKINRFIIRIRGRYVQINDIIRDLNNIGIKEGDIILLHSSLKSVGYVVGGARTIVSAIIKVIGPEGTLVVPTYSIKGTMLETCMDNDYIFDYNISETNLGAIPSDFLTHKNIYRSIHPTHSISAIGKYAKKITENHHIGKNTYGKNSPWGKIIELDGKIFGIGITLGPTTQYHYVEDIMGTAFPIKVKVDNIYKLKCKIEDNSYIEVEVQPLDPKIAQTRIDKKRNSFIRHFFWNIYVELKILNIGKVGKARSWWVNAKDFCDVLIKLANLGITIYSTKEELKLNNLYPFDINKLLG